MIEIVLLGSLAVLVYTFAGYPLLIALLARWFPAAVRKGPFEPRIAVIVVAHNEAGRIARKLDTCLGLDYPAERIRVVVASDGSTDGTNEVVAGHGDPRVSLLAFAERRGKAACLNDAIALCDEEILVLTDARQRLDAGAARRLVENFADPAVGAVSAELVLETDGASNFAEGVGAYWRYEKFIRRQESALHSTIGVTGALYALRRSCFREIPADTILDDVLIPMNVVLSGKRVVFEAGARAFDLASADAAQERVRKIRTVAGNYQLILAHRRLFCPARNPVLLQLVSHKVLRLLAPFCLVLLLVTTLILAPEAPGWLLLLGAQLAGYSLPALGAISPAARRWRIVKVATAFVLLNAFAVLGLVEFLRNRNAHLWKTRPRSAS